ncbi:MAG: M20/M25/M40 family metallo-hydrolase [Bacteroidota bacterium]
MKKQIAITLFAGMVLSLSHAIYGQETESSPVNSITEAEMRDHIFFLASDYLGGRVGPSEEYEIAAHYVASQFASAGVEPLSSDQGNMSGYFQEVPFEKKVFSQEIKWILHSKEGKKEFIHNEDYKILESRTMVEEPLDVVFAGYGISEPDYGWNDFKEIDIAGKMVIILAGAPVKKGKPVLPDSVHQQYNTMMGLQKKIFPILKMEPTSLILIFDEQTKAMVPFEAMPSNFSDVLYKYKGVEGSEQGLKIPMICTVTDEVAQSIFEGQKYDPADIAGKGLKKYRCYQLENVSIEAVFPVLESSEISLKNVVGWVEGTDPELQDQIITVGAHLDHVAYPTGEVANGADDNASGSAGVMEIAEAIAMNPPRRSVVFIAYNAEEMGLHGSNYFVNAGPFTREHISFNLNLDMIGRTTAANKESRSHYVVLADEYESKMVPFISEINDRTLAYPLIFKLNSSFSGSSDHASYSNVGIPSFCFFSGMHEDLHRPGDDAEKIEYDKAVKISRLTYLITMKLANMDEIPDFLE